MMTNRKNAGIGVLAAAAVAWIGAPAWAAVVDYKTAVLGEVSVLGYYSFDAAATHTPTGVDANSVTDDKGAGTLYPASTFRVDGTLATFVAGAPDGSASGQHYQSLADNTSVFASPGTSTNWPAAGNYTPYSFTDTTGTVGLWFTHSGDAGNNTLAAIRDGAGTRYSIHANNNNTVGLWNNASFQTRSTGGIDVDDGDWHYLAVIFESASSVRFVLDGNDLGATTNGLANTNANVDEMGIGGYASSGAETWRGGIDEVAFFENPLSVATIQTLHAAMFSSSPPPPPGPTTSVAIVNPSFEIGANANAFTNNVAPTGWAMTATGTATFRFGTGSEVTSEIPAGYAPDGSAAAYANRGVGFTLSQLLADTSVAGTYYTLSVLLGDDQVGGHVGYGAAYDIHLLIGGVELIPVDVDLPSVDNVNAFVTATKTYYYTGPGGESLQIVIDSPGGISSAALLLIDNVTLEATSISIPAPAPLPVGLAAVTLAACRRRRHRLFARRG